MKGAPRLHQESVRIAPGALLDLAARHPGRYPVLLDSAAQGALSQVSLLAALPRGMLWLDSQGRLHQDGALPELPGSGFIESLEAHWQQARAAGASRPPELPFAGGWFVYLGYELALETEPSLRRWWPEASFGDARPVAAALRIPAAILLDADGSGHIVAEQGVAEAELAQLRADLASAGSTAMQTAAEDIAAPAIDLVEEEPAAYLERIRRAQDYIRAGDIYQANLSRWWRGQLPAAYPAADLYRRLRRSNPAPFAGLAQFGEFRVLSSSPERLLRLCTIDGARALGMEDRIGSLEPGRDADLCAVSLHGAHTRPVIDPVATLFHSARAADVVLSTVRGRVLFEHGVVRTIDETAVGAEIDRLGARMREAL